MIVVWIARVSCTYVQVGQAWFVRITRRLPPVVGEASTVSVSTVVDIVTSASVSPSKFSSSKARMDGFGTPHKLIIPTSADISQVYIHAARLIDQIRRLTEASVKRRVLTGNATLFKPVIHYDLSEKPRLEPAACRYCFRREEIYKGGAGGELTRQRRSSSCTPSSPPSVVRQPTR